jgi:hypothetical protein
LVVVYLWKSVCSLAVAIPMQILCAHVYAGRWTLVPVLP